MTLFYSNKLKKLNRSKNLKLTDILLRFKEAYIFLINKYSKEKFIF